MQTFRITYKLEKEFSVDIDANSETEARAIFAEKEYIGALPSSGELRSGWFKKTILSAEPVSIHDYSIDYQYTVFCNKVVSASSEEDARKQFKEIGFEMDDEEDSTEFEITNIKLLEDKQ